MVTKGYGLTLGEQQAHERLVLGALSEEHPVKAWERCQVLEADRKHWMESWLALWLEAFNVGQGDRAKVDAMRMEWEKTFEENTALKAEIVRLKDTLQKLTNGTSASTEWESTTLTYTAPPLCTCELCKRGWERVAVGEDQVNAWYGSHDPESPCIDVGPVKPSDAEKGEDKPEHKHHWVANWDGPVRCDCGAVMEGAWAGVVHDPDITLNRVMPGLYRYEDQEMRQERLKIESEKPLDELQSHFACQRCGTSMIDWGGIKKCPTCTLPTEGGIS